MKLVYLIPVIAGCLAAPLWAQGAIYRCGNEFSNTITDADAKTRGCKLVSGGNVTVVPAQRPAAAKASGATARVDSADQRAKDSDSRLILEAELKKAEARRAELIKEFNNGEPEKLGPEQRNNQKYLDRVAEMKDSIARNERDIEGIRRELGRLQSSAAAPTSSAPH